ncbi:C4-type zinc ribbon domain-containing protein [uncultured Akkermansia sp.]|uniref:zinc ribbon domain-containing protein n=1 Tax=uncultured Akkermansia sp. TaxID=512294 RepID=UPI00265D034A|nr:C4-type zinc ribbon domain-containing protein [uncultured Akkermansia sp.]
MNHADLDQLLILQEKDVRISKLRKELASLPEQRTRLLRQMEAIKQKAVAAKQEVASVEKSIRDVEATVETKRAYIGKMKTLQSNTRKNEEYQMCIQEMEKTEAAIDALETTELELMERLETAKTDMAQKIQRARDAQREMEETLARFDRTAETDKELLDHLNAERADLAAAVPEDSLGEYERMTKSKGVPVIVPMDEKGHCGGCHMVITDNARMKVLGGHETVYCDNCHRILH